eukprot:Filipodium_phascolosomae@DN5674_c0_g1_i1.p1
MKAVKRSTNSNCDGRSSGGVEPSSALKSCVYHSNMSGMARPIVSGPTALLGATSSNNQTTAAPATPGQSKNIENDHRRHNQNVQVIPPPEGQIVYPVGINSPIPKSDHVFQASNSPGMFPVAAGMHSHLTPRQPISTQKRHSLWSRINTQADTNLGSSTEVQEQTSKPRVMGTRLLEPETLTTPIRLRSNKPVSPVSSTRPVMIAPKRSVTKPVITNPKTAPKGTTTIQRQNGPFFQIDPRGHIVVHKTGSTVPVAAGIQQKVEAVYQTDHMPLQPALYRPSFIHQPQHASYPLPTTARMAIQIAIHPSV